MRGDTTVPFRAEGAADDLDADRVVVDERPLDVHEGGIRTAYVLFDSHRLVP